MSVAKLRRLRSSTVAVLSAPQCVMKVVVGLGNPGTKYQDTRHNVGFDVCDVLARRHAAPPSRGRFDSDVTEFPLASEKVLLVWPQTFMNLSGKAVQPLLAFYQIEPDSLMVICDDLNLEVGRLRVRKSGSAGGQKGLSDIIRRLGTEDVPRLRIGIGRPPSYMDAADYVLGKIRKEERPQIDQAVLRAADAVELWVQEGIVAAMNRFNPSAGSSGAADSAGES